MNPLIKRIRSLQRRKYRLQERAFVVEGVRAVEDMLAAGIMPHSIIVSQHSDWTTREEFRAVTRLVTPEVFATLSDVVNPQGVLAMMPVLPEVELPALESSPLIVVLDGIGDPGNMGTLIRSAAGAGVDHVVIAPNSVDPYHPKVVRAAMGAHLRVPFSQLSLERINAYLPMFPLIALADAQAKTVYHYVNWRTACAVIIGSEAWGPTSEIRSLANVLVAIPLANGVESLNAGVAGSILMFEAARQRSQ